MNLAIEHVCLPYWDTSCDQLYSSPYEYWWWPARIIQSSTCIFCLSTRYIMLVTLIYSHHRDCIISMDQYGGLYSQGYNTVSHHTPYYKPLNHCWCVHIPQTLTIQTQLSTSMYIQSHLVFTSRVHNHLRVFHFLFVEILHTPSLT